MSDHESTTPFGPGFVAASIVIAAIVICGLIVLVAGGSNTPAGTHLSNPAAPAAGGGSEPVGAPAATPDTTCPAAPGSASGDNRGSASDDRAGSGAASSGGGGSAGCVPSSRSARSGCSLSGGDQGVPVVAPAVDGWEVSRRVVVPRSTAFGPGVVDSDGFRRCFAHSPTGAVFAAYNVLAALGDQTKATATARKLMLPGPETDELLRATAKETSSTNTAQTQLAGYRVLAANRDQVTVTLAVPVETQYMSLTVTMVWHDHDWRLQPPPSGAAIGAPFAQVRNLADFVKWSGL
ncbi:hypothetical protein GCM10009745_67130 [Kribbella yunnanensis]|uniref:DUF8175 domain-containing protein n=1 Tax=Kribbella yunnanensis TaxID=190194 RepID=A0ABP4UQ44_9ACTN